MEKENSYGLIKANIQENSLTIIFMEKENTNGQMVEFSMETG